jgi:hypothetical protein
MRDSFGSIASRFSPPVYGGVSSEARRAQEDEGGMTTDIPFASLGTSPGYAKAPISAIHNRQERPTRRCAGLYTR